jgi:hypothetical protein
VSHSDDDSGEVGPGLGAFEVVDVEELGDGDERG